MTPPNGYVEAVRVTGVVKVPDIYTTDGTRIPGCIVGPGDTAVIPEDEALTSDVWEAPQALIDARQAEANKAIVPAPPSAPAGSTNPPKQNGGS